MKPFRMALCIWAALAASPLCAGQAYYMFSFTSRTVGVVDLQTGVSSVLTDQVTGTGPLLNGTYCLEIENSDNILVFGRNGEADGAWIVRVNRTTGNREVISADGASPVGTGPSFAPVGLGTFRLKMMPGGTHVMVDDYAVGIMTIELATGNRSYFTKGTPTAIGTGPYTLFTDYILEPSGDVLVWDVSAGFLRVDAATGNRNNASIAAPIDFGYPFHEDGTGNIYYWKDSPSEVRVFNLDTLSDTVVSSFTVGSGPMFSEAADVKAVGGRLFVLVSGALFEIDLATGDRTVVADGTNGIPVVPFFVSAPFDMAIDLGATSVPGWLMFD